MKKFLGLLHRSRTGKASSGPPDSAFFSTVFANQAADPSKLILWEARAKEMDAVRMPPNRGGKLLQALWAQDKYMAHLNGDAVRRIEKFCEFAHVDEGRELIRQDEYGNFMVVLLTGTIAVDRDQLWGETLRLAIANPGEILGEMSLLDSGIRSSSCTTLTECEIAVLSAHGMDDMMITDPQLAASLIALLAHKLSLRLRAVSARLSKHQL